MTVQILTERIRRILSQGFPTINDRVKDAEIKFQIGSAANRLLRAEHFNTLSEGDTIPDGAIIAQYERILVSRTYNDWSVANLPVTPMRLPAKAGVFSVYPSGYPELEFLPVDAGVYNILKRDKIVSPIHRKLYSYESGKVVVYDDLIGAGITQLDMKLVVMDISRLGDNDVLPITPEIEAQIMNDVIAIYVPKPADR